MHSAPLGFDFKRVFLSAFCCLRFASASANGTFHPRASLTKMLREKSPRKLFIQTITFSPTKMTWPCWSLKNGSTFKTTSFLSACQRMMTFWSVSVVTADNNLDYTIAVNVSFVISGEMGTVAGWGRLSEGGSLPSILQYVSTYRKSGFLRRRHLDCLISLRFLRCSFLLCSSMIRCSFHLQKPRISGKSTTLHLPENRPQKAWGSQIAV